jgi:hypothetical protein
VKSAAKKEGTALIVLGGAHDLFQSARRVGGGLRVRPRDDEGGREFAD